MNEIKEYTEKMFDNIKHIDEFGNEYWLAIELQSVLQYTEWRKFKGVIDKAKEANTNEIMAHYDNKNFTRKNVVNISLDTTKEDELFNDVRVEKEYVRMKHSELDYDSKKKDEKEFELSL